MSRDYVAVSGQKTRLNKLKLDNIVYAKFFQTSKVSVSRRDNAIFQKIKIDENEK